MLLVRQHDRLLLQKRPPTGIWAGMWSLPEIDSTLGGNVVPDGDGLSRRLATAGAISSCVYPFSLAHHAVAGVRGAVLKAAAGLAVADTPPKHCGRHSGAGAQDIAGLRTDIADSINSITDSLFV